MILGFLLLKNNETFNILLGDNMVITIDVGNTDIVSILYDEDGNKVRHQRISLERSKIQENTDYFVVELIRTWHIEDVDYIVSCVVPQIASDLKVSLNKYFNKEGTFIDYTMIDFLGEDLPYPAEIGADLLAATAAVVNDDKPTLIVDMGSATKYILVKDNKLDSVAILLGVKNNMLALSDSIKHLPNVQIQFTDEPLGRDTIEAIQSGLMYSTLFTIEGYANALEEKLQTSFNKVLTGGIGNLFKDRLPDFSFEADLVNDGLYEIYKNNKELVK